MIGLRNPNDPKRTEKIREIRGWVRARLSLDEQTTVMVTELTCKEPGCPPVETVIAVLHGQGRNQQFKVFAPMTSVTESQVVEALRAPVATGDTEKQHG